MYLNSILNIKNNQINIPIILQMKLQKKKILYNQPKSKIKRAILKKFKAKMNLMMMRKINNLQKNYN